VEELYAVIVLINNMAFVAIVKLENIKNFFKKLLIFSFKNK
jgi:hypothetical protein